MAEKIVYNVRPRPKSNQTIPKMLHWSASDIQSEAISNDERLVFTSFNYGTITKCWLQPIHASYIVHYNVTYPQLLSEERMWFRSNWQLIISGFTPNFGQQKNLVFRRFSNWKRCCSLKCQHTFPNEMSIPSSAMLYADGGGGSFFGQSISVFRWENGIEIRKLLQSNCIGGMDGPAHWIELCDLFVEFVLICFLSGVWIVSQNCYWLTMQSMLCWLFAIPMPMPSFSISKTCTTLPGLWKIVWKFRILSMT